MGCLYHSPPVRAQGSMEEPEEVGGWKEAVSGHSRPDTRTKAQTVRTCPGPPRQARLNPVWRKGWPWSPTVNEEPRRITGI